ncbi:MAG TPA: hypothetical protein VHD90_15040 [Phototrophicaceae bacterium]|nr:hypothetical protein [Phototrophicaceae bacterium]
MIDNTRLENSLIHVARRYAPALIPAGWQKAGDYPGTPPDLARALASYNVLVMIGDAQPTAVKGWTDGYQSFYQTMCAALFPSYTRIGAFFVDQNPPLIVALYGEATPVILALAGFVVPYVVARQGTRPSDVEILGMMDMILDELEATDLPREEYRRLRDDGAAVLRGLLEGGARQLPLTPAARPIFDDMAAQRATEGRLAPPISVPESVPAPTTLPEPPPPPATMPEEMSVPPAAAPASPPLPPVSTPESAPRRFDPDAVPLFFSPGTPPRGTNTNGTNVPPPLPPRDPQRR